MIKKQYFFNSCNEMTENFQELKKNISSERKNEEKTGYIKNKFTFKSIVMKLKHIKDKNFKSLLRQR